MTKRELLGLLAPYADEQYIYIRLHTDAHPQGCQIVIQGVEPTPPWFTGPNLVALVAHERNAEVHFRSVTSFSAG